MPLATPRQYAAMLDAAADCGYAHVVAEASPVLVALHTDHCPPGHVDDWLRPLLAESRRRVERNAAPLFNSHMFDGSALPLAENLRISLSCSPCGPSST
jgi:fructose/tagatose bisphosphate aldolase